MPRGWSESSAKVEEINDTPSLPKNMRVSLAGQKFIKSWEQGPNGGFASRQYASPEGGTDTIGWGHKLLPGENYPRGISSDEAERLFQKDLERHSDYVRNSVKVPLTQQQFDALVAMSFNVPSAFRQTGQISGLLRELNAGNYDNVPTEMMR